MAFLLDTNIVSFLLKDPHGPVAKRFRLTPRKEICTTSIVEAELRFGAERMPANARVRILLPEVLSNITVMAWDSSCAQQHSVLRALLEKRGETMGFADSMIAAHALALDFVLVTNDSAFERVPALKLQDWTKGPQSS